MRRLSAALIASVAFLAFAAGCSSTGSGGGGGGKSVLDLTWGWGWNAVGSEGPYRDVSEVERQEKLDYYREHVRTEDAAGAPVRPVEQVRFLEEAPSNAPTGEEADPAAFVDTTGRPVRLEDFRGKRNVVLVFTRGFPGYICPMCTSYTAQIAHRYAEISGAGAEVLLVFPGSPDRVGEFVKAARAILEEQGPGALPFPVLLDVNLRNVEAFGIAGDLAKPSTYLIDAAGRVRYAFVGNLPHERPDVDVLLGELHRIGAP